MPESISMRDQEVPPGPNGWVALYRFYDTADQLLYVGITSAPSSRWAHHRHFAEGTWWSSAVRKRVRWYATRAEAARAETDAIRREAPLWNVAGAPSSNPRLSIRRFSEATTGCEHDQCNADMMIYQVIASEIAAGEPGVGEMVPPLRSVTARFGVSPRVARNAIAMLKEDGLIEAVTAKGLQRQRVIANRPAPGWNPPPLPDGRDALEVLLTALRTKSTVLPIIATREMGLSVNVVRGWAIRHPHISEAIEVATREGQAARLRRRLTARPGRGKRTDLPAA